MMKVSTRGRYALRLMIDLAQHRDDGYISLKEISARQDITVRYLEQIIAILLKAGFVQSFRGKSGGYRLSRHPREYTTEDILKLTEGSLLPLSCTASQNSPCPRASSCATLPFWRGLQKSLRITCAASRWRTCPSSRRKSAATTERAFNRSPRPEHSFIPFCFGLMSHFFTRHLTSRPALTIYSLLSR